MTTTDRYTLQLAAAARAECGSYAAAAKALAAALSDLGHPVASAGAADRLVRAAEAAEVEPERWPAERAVLRAAAVRAARLAVVRAAYEQCNYRRCSSSWVSGTHHLVVAEGGTVAARSSTDTGWSDNRKWSATRSHHSLTVLPSWAQDTAECGAVVDSLLTLAAAPVAARTLPAGVERAWTATWVRQGAGTALVAESGYLVRAGNVTLHAESLEQGARLLRRRLAPTTAPRSELTEAERVQRSVMGLYRRGGNVSVTLDDSVQAGNCATGTRDWSERHLAGATEATVEQVLLAALESGDRLPRALVACAVAVRHSRTQRAA